MINVVLICVLPTGPSEPGHVHPGVDVPELRKVCARPQQQPFAQGTYVHQLRHHQKDPLRLGQRSIAPAGCLHGTANIRIAAPTTTEGVHVTNESLHSSSIEA